MTFVVRSKQFTDKTLRAMEWVKKWVRAQKMFIMTSEVDDLQSELMIWSRKLTKQQEKQMLLIVLTIDDFLEVLHNVFDAIVTERLNYHKSPVL